MIDLNDNFIEQYATASPQEKHQFARELTFGQKFHMGGLLFDRECRMIKARIKQRMPSASDEHILDSLRIVIDFIHDDANFGNQ